MNVGRVVIEDIRHIREYASELAKQGLMDVARVGSKFARILLFVATFGSLRPDILTARKPGEP